MENSVKKLKITAEHYRFLYRKNKCTREEALKNIQPYIDLVNERLKESAKIYKQKYKPISFSGFVR